MNLCKVSRVNLLGFAGPEVSVITTQLCNGDIQVAIDNVQMNGPGWVPIKLYLHRRQHG